jgi:hypothetical protein
MLVVVLKGAKIRRKSFAFEDESCFKKALLEVSASF